MSDNISNDAYTTVDGNQTDSTTTLTVLDTSNFPAGSFHITVQNPKKLWGEAVTSGEGEIMLASVSTGTTLSVTRAQGGTSAVELTDEWAVYQSITNRIFDQKADLEGSTSQTFNVATATAAEHAMRLEQRKVKQIVTGSTSTVTQVTDTTYVDSTLTASITPTSTSSKILIVVNQSVDIVATSSVSSLGALINVLRDSTEIHTPQTNPFFVNDASSSSIRIRVRHPIILSDSPSTTSSTTYKTQIKSASASGRTATAQVGGSLSYIQLIEYD